MKKTPIPIDSINILFFLLYLSVFSIVRKTKTKHNLATGQNPVVNIQLKPSNILGTKASGNQSDAPNCFQAPESITLSPLQPFQKQNPGKTNINNQNLGSSARFLPAFETLSCPYGRSGQVVLSGQQPARVDPAPGCASAASNGGLPGSKRLGVSLGPLVCLDVFLFLLWFLRYSKDS